ncbi:helix-turn-helix domain-containing protein [uncultured Eubacterium sp.]|uniref:TetR/AcrR family transcriptional regulator n=1 Tax=uncultured Eubacterium sp. TaxID=165185 RepID=UPI0025DBD406|nr:helix-turn-helix domain-containing protein [uncultured Eubacterium sp.]
MPPKAKFTREEIVSAALEVARSKGIEAVTAREVGNYLGTSSSPVFVAFKNMDELLNEVYNSAVKEYSDYIADSVKYTPAFKQFGFRLIEFASTQPNLFKMIYKYRQGEKSYSKMIMSIPAADFCVQTVMEQAQVNYENARLIFEEVLLAGLGICYMIADNKCTFTEQDLNKYLGIAYRGAVLTVTTLNEDEYAVHPSINN